MERGMIWGTVATAQPLLDGFEEKAFDGDFVLPDYQPEIAAILKCTLTPVIEDQQKSGDRLLVDGSVQVEVLYVNETRNRIGRFLVDQPFTAAFTVENLSEQASISLSTIVDHVNCRAMGPRRVDIHGSFRVHAKIWDICEQELPCQSDEEGLYVQIGSAVASLPSRATEKSFAVNEWLDPGNGASVRAVIRTDSTARITECRVLPGKAIIKGELLLHTLFEIESDADAAVYGSCDHTVLFSQMIDAEQLSDGDRPERQIQVLSCDLHPEKEEGTGRSLLSLSARLAVSLQVWNSQPTTVITDAYSSHFPLKVESAPLTIRERTEPLEQTVLVRESVDIPQSVTEILDLWCDSAFVSRQAQTGTEWMQIHLLAKDAEGMIACYDRSVDYSLELPVCGQEILYRAEIMAVNYRVNDQKQLEISATVLVSCVGIHAQSFIAVTSLTADESAPYPAQNAALKLIFASAGESIWEIAKGCRASAESLMAENDLTEDTLSRDTLLLIPLT